MWSLIPWRTLLKLALPWIREFFVGQFNSKSYFAKHPVILVCLLAIIIMTLSLLFLTEQAIYHANRSYELEQRVLQLEGQLKEKPKKEIHSTIECKPNVDQGSAKEVVLVPTTPKPIPVRSIETRVIEKTVQVPVEVKVPVHVPVPVYKERVINNTTIVKAPESYDGSTLNAKLTKINEE